MKKLLLLIMLLYPALSGSQSTDRVADMGLLEIRFLVDGDALLPAFDLSISAVKGGNPRISRHEMTDSFSSSLTSGSFGSFSERGIPSLGIPLREGEYRVAVTGLPANYTVKSIIGGTVDLLRFPVTIKRDLVPITVITFGVLEKAGGSTVSGRVTGLLPDHLASRPRMALSGAGGLLSARADKEGRFEFTHVPPGNYTARVTTTIYPVQPSPKVSVKVSGKDVSDVRIVMPPVKEVSGRAQVEGAGPLPGLHFSVSGDFGNATAIVNPRPNTETFTLILPEGDVGIKVDTASLPKGYTLRSLRYGSADLISNAKVRVAAANPAQLQVVLAVTTAAVAIRLPDGTPILTRPPEPNAWFTVKGRVTGIEQGTPPVSLSLLNNGAGSGPFAFVVRQDGPFELDKALQGPHVLRASAGAFSVSQLIEVAGKDVSGVEVVIPPL